MGIIEEYDFLGYFGALLSKTYRTETYRIGESIDFSGYVDDFDHNISAIEFSLDDGAHWTAYSTPGVVRERGVNWRFSYVPEVAGMYKLKVRAIDGHGNAAFLVAETPFRVVSQNSLSENGSVVEASESNGKVESVEKRNRCDASVSEPPNRDIRIRALGGVPLEQAFIYRSGELAQACPEDTAQIVRLGIETIYDIRTRREVSRCPDIRIPDVCTVALEPEENRRKDASKRLVAGVIGEYGAPEARMRANYRRYVHEYPIIGTALRTMAERGTPALIHCANGKDRTGVLCAVMQRLAGVHTDEILADYANYNSLNRDKIEAEASRLGVGMTTDERAILMSFLEARPVYIDEFFSEVEKSFGSFEAYVSDELRITAPQRESLAHLVMDRRQL